MLLVSSREAQLRDVEDRARPRPADPRREALLATLREVVERLAPIERTPCSAGEREAAQWLARRLGAIAQLEVALEDEPAWGTFPPTATALGTAGVLGAALALRGQRAAGVLLGAASAAGIVDEAQNGPRSVRRLARRRRATVNVIARVPPRPGAAEQREPVTFVVIAHHDAPQTGFIFDQTVHRRLHALAPELIEGIKTSPPQWWFGLAAPLLTLATALTGRRRFAAAGLAIGALGTLAAADVWRGATVAGANDNLSGVAALVALAELLGREPLPGVRVLLVSCGAEETLQDGIRAFVARHRAELDPARTHFVNLDTIGSPRLVMLEGEGPIWMEDYAGPWLREQLSACAQRLGIRLRRGYRARASTDSVIPSRAGYATATLASITPWGTPANYHLPSDVPANLDYDTVADATSLVHELVRAHSS